MTAIDVCVVTEHCICTLRNLRTALLRVITQPVLVYFLPMFRDNLSVPSSGFKITQRVVGISWPRFRTAYQAHLQGPRILLAYYAASSGNFLPTFRDNLSVPSSGFKITQRIVAISYWCFGTTYRSHPQDSRGPETSESNYHYSLRNNPKERRSQLLRGGSLKSRNHKPGHRFFRKKDARAGPERQGPGGGGGLGPNGKNRKYGARIVSFHRAK